MRLSKIDPFWRVVLGALLVLLGITGLASEFGRCAGESGPCAPGYHLEPDRDTCREEAVPVGPGVGRTVTCDERCTEDK